MASGPITSWQIDEEKMETVTDFICCCCCSIPLFSFSFLFSDFIFLGSKFTADGDCNHKITRHLFLGRKAITNLDSY